MEPQEPVHGLEGPGLTDLGIEEAREAGRRLKAMGIQFDVAFTSDLSRAQAHLRADPGGDRPAGPEDDRGPGPERARLRRSLRPQQGRCPRPLGRGAGACLAPLLRRAPARRREPEGHGRPRAALLHPRNPAPRMRGERVLVAAHGNSLRALVMVLDGSTPTRFRHGTRNRHSPGLRPQRGHHRRQQEGAGGVTGNRGTSPTGFWSGSRP